MPPRQTARPIAVDRTGDPDELVGTAEANRVLGYTQPDRPLPAYLLEQADGVERNPDGSIKRRQWKRRTLWRWADTHRATEQTTIDGRPALDRTGIAAHTGFAVAAVAKWIAAADTNGFPARVDDRWYYTDEVEDWVRQHVAGYRPGIDTAGPDADPHELVDIDEVARMAGFSSVATLRQSALWDQLVEHNDPADNEKMQRGRPRRRWPRYVAQQIISADTPRRGRRPATTRTIDRSGEPHELVGVTEAARVLGYQHRSGLPAKVLDRADVSSPRKWRRSTLWSIADEENMSAQA